MFYHYIEKLRLESYITFNLILCFISVYNYAKTLPLTWKFLLIRCCAILEFCYTVLYVFNVLKKPIIKAFSSLSFTQL